MGKMRTLLLTIRARLATPYVQVACLVLFLVALFQGGGLGSPMHFDDAHAIVENPAIKSLGNLPTFFVDPGAFSTTGRMYRPIVLSTLAFDHWIGGGAPWAFKLGNLLQHLTICLLLLASLPLLFARAGITGVKARFATLLAVLLFGLHPLHVETLNLVSSRSEILIALGFVIALAGWLHEGAKGRPARQVAWLCAGTAFACLSKETGIFVAPAILLLEFVLPSGGKRDPLRQLALRFVPAMAIVVGYLYLRQAAFALLTVPGHSFAVTVSDPYSGGGRSMMDQIQGMTWFLPKALELILFPWSLSVDHTVFFDRPFLSLPVLSGAAIVLLPIVLALLWYRRRPLFSFAVLAAVAFSLPWILVPLNQPLAEHRLYLPVLFLVLPIAVGLLGLLSRPSRGWQRALVALSAILLLLGGRSWSRSRLWYDRSALWQDALVSYPESFRALNGLGQALIDRGRLQESIPRFEQCVAVYPKYLPGVQNLCEARVRLLDEVDDRAFHDETVRLTEDHAEWHWKDPFVRLLAARARLGRYRLSGSREDLAAAKAWALSCLAMVPPKMLVYKTAAEVLRRSQRKADRLEAIALLDAWQDRRLPVLNVDAWVDFLDYRAGLLIESDLLRQAEAVALRMRREQPTDPRGLLRLKEIYHATGRVEQERRMETMLRMLRGQPVPTIPNR